LRTFQVRKLRRCLESGSLLPPQAALRRFATVAALQFADLSGPQTAPLPRKRLASSAADGASRAAGIARLKDPLRFFKLIGYKSLFNISKYAGCVRIFSPDEGDLRKAYFVYVEEK